MTRANKRHLDELRAKEGPAANTLIDEFTDGDMDRGEFLRRASVFGLSVGAVGAVLAAHSASAARPCEPSCSQGGRQAEAGNRRAADRHNRPVDRSTTTAGSSSAESPASTSSAGGRRSRSIPELAVKWTPNANAQVWTYNLRPNVQFQNGQTMTADDVVATYKRLTDPNGGSQALSAFEGVLTPGRRTEGRRPHGRVPPGRAERELPLPDELHHLPGDHPAGELQAGDLHVRTPDDGRVQDRQRDAGRQCHV